MPEINGRGASPAEPENDLSENFPASAESALKLIISPDVGSEWKPAVDALRNPEGIHAIDEVLKSAQESSVQSNCIDAFTDMMDVKHDVVPLAREEVEFIRTSVSHFFADGVDETVYRSAKRCLKIARILLSAGESTP